MIKSATETLEDLPSKEIDGIRYYREDHVLQSMIKFRDQFIVNQKDLYKRPIGKKEIKGLATYHFALNVITDLTGFTKEQLEAKNRNNRELLDARVMLSAIVYGDTNDYQLTGRLMSRHHSTIINSMNTHNILFSEKAWGSKEYRELFIKAMEEMSKLNRGG